MNHAAEFIKSNNLRIRRQILFSLFNCGSFNDAANISECTAFNYTRIVRNVVAGKCFGLIISLSLIFHEWTAGNDGKLQSVSWQLIKPSTFRLQVTRRHRLSKLVLRHEIIDLFWVCCQSQQFLFPYSPSPIKHYTTAP
jgi:hypothetical protein